MTKPAITQATTTSDGVPEAVRLAAQANSAKIEDVTNRKAMAESNIVHRKAPTVEAEPKLYVYDLLATKGPRTHEFIDKNGIGAPYNFPDATTARAVPWSAAIGLVEIGGFAVYEADGTKLEASKERDEKVTLKSNETIARYDQLTLETLQDTCKRLDAPKDLKKKEDMVSWLINYNQQRSDARQRADELGLNKSLRELLEDAGGDADNINAMDKNTAQSVINGKGIEDISSPQTVAV